MKTILAVLFFFLFSSFAAHAGELLSGFFHKNYQYINYLYIPQEDRFVSLVTGDENITAQLQRLENGDLLTIRVERKNDSCFEIVWIESIGLQKFLGLWIKNGISLNVTSFNTAILRANSFNRLLPAGVKKVYRYSIIAGSEANEWVIFFSDQSDSYFATAIISEYESKISFYDNENGELIETFEFVKISKQRLLKNKTP